MIHKTREAWYLAAANLIARHVFKYDLPKIRIGCGWPTAARKKRGGECFSRKCSGDDTFEIFVSPKFADPYLVLAVLVHEFCHTIAGLKAGHKKPFIEVMQAVGMVKPWTKCKAGEPLIATLAVIYEKLGPYPHAEMTLEQREAKKQGTRLIKVACPKCGYVARVTRKWLTEVGAPLCPAHKVAFKEEKKSGS